jgi:hypothetical protein
MGNVMMYIQVFEAFITLCRQVVDQMNKIFPEAGTGSTKLALAVQMVEKGLTTIENGEHFLTTLLPMITPTVTLIADGLKSVGVKPMAGNGNPPPPAQN